MRVALVTGAASGNGAAIVTRLLADGLAVAAVDRDGAALERTRAEVWSAAGDRVRAIEADVADADAVAAAVEATRARLGGLDVLVNNAGITGGPQATLVHETPVAELDRVLAVNVRGPFLLARAALPIMLAAGGGSIVNIASVAGIVAFPQRAAYTTSKGAIVQLTRSIAADYGARGIRCNALCPGMIDTPMTHWRLAQPALRDEVLARIPQREIGTPEDVSNAVAFLISSQATYFNGAALVMDGAMTAI